MKIFIILSIALALPAAQTGAAQLYRWVDEKGNVEWRDTPPPASAKKVEQRRIDSSTIETSELPYSLQQTVKNFPVTLWATNCGAPCDQGRALLARRGVPHTEKDPQQDIETFKKLSGGLEVPVLFIGSNRIKSYLESEWDAALDSAGYPRTPLPGAKPAAKASPAEKAPRAQTPPVRLYTHPECGAPCADAKSLLAGRGVSFQEIVAQEQAAIDELQKLSSDMRVPVLVVGQVVRRGFSAPDYHLTLDAAGFPRGQQAAKP